MHVSLRKLPDSVQGLVNLGRRGERPGGEADGSVRGRAQRAVRRQSWCGV